MAPVIPAVSIKEELFCSGKVQYYDQPVGIVVANNHQVALEAAKKVSIYYSPPLDKPLLTVPEVLNAADAKERIEPKTTVKATKKGKIPLRRLNKFHLFQSTIQVKPLPHPILCSYSNL